MGVGRELAVGSLQLAIILKDKIANCRLRTEDLKEIN